MPSVAHVPAEVNVKNAPSALNGWLAGGGEMGERTRAYDAQQDRQRRFAQDQARRDMAERQAREAAELQAIARKRFLDLFKRVVADPREINELSLSDARLLYLEAAKFERVVRGEPDTIAEHRHGGTDGGSIRLLLEEVIAEAKTREAPGDGGVQQGGSPDVRPGDAPVP